MVCAAIYIIVLSSLGVLSCCQVCASMLAKPSVDGNPRLGPSHHLPAPQLVTQVNAADSSRTHSSFIFELQPTTFQNDSFQGAYIIAFLMGKAVAWATAIWEQQGCTYLNY